MTKFSIILCLFISGETYTFILIDWKKDISSGSEEGHILSKVNGTFEHVSSDMNKYFYKRTDTGSSGKLYVLDTNYGTG